MWSASEEHWRLVGFQKHPSFKSTPHTTTEIASTSRCNCSQQALRIAAGFLLGDGLEIQGYLSVPRPTSQIYFQGATASCLYSSIYVAAA